MANYYLHVRTDDGRVLNASPEQMEPTKGSKVLKVDGRCPSSFNATHFLEDGVVKERVPAACTKWSAEEVAAHASGKKEAREAALATRAATIAELKATGSDDVKKLLGALGL